MSVLLRQPHGFEGLGAIGIDAVPRYLRVAKGKDIVDAHLHLYPAVPALSDEVQERNDVFARIDELPVFDPEPLPDIESVALPLQEAIVSPVDPIQTRIYVGVLLPFHVGMDDCLTREAIENAIPSPLFQVSFGTFETPRYGSLGLPMVQIGRRSSPGRARQLGTWQAVLQFKGRRSPAARTRGRLRRPPRSPDRRR